jgi:hypothetical protein
MNDRTPPHPFQPIAEIRFVALNDALKPAPSLDNDRTRVIAGAVCLISQH